MTTQITLNLDNTEWIEQVRPLVLKRFHGREFCADDLHGVLPEPPHYNAYGGLIHSLSKDHLIEKTGHTPSQRSGRNGSLIRTWRVKE